MSSLKAGLVRTHAAILSADVVGYTRLMELDEHETHRRLMHLRFGVMEPILARFGGRVIKHNGDGFVAMFPDAPAAAEAARAMQRAVMLDEAAIPVDRRIAFRMGLNVADIFVEDHDIYGDGVNIAARLQSHAEPNGIVMSGPVAEISSALQDMTSLDLGQMYLRNREQPVRVLSLRFRDAPPAPLGEVGPGHEARPSIAVLPFRRHLAGKDDYFADGFTDNIIRTLAGLKDLFVIARGSTLGFGGGEIDAPAIGAALGVRYILYGSVQKAGQRLRVTTELIEAETAKVLRPDRYDGTIDDIFDFQDRIAVEVAKAISPRVRELELKRAMRKHPQNMTAYDLVLQALDAMNHFDYASFARARGHLQRALVIDPGYGPTYSYAAWWHNYRIGQEWSTDIAMDSVEALRLAAAAMRHDQDDALALATFAHVNAFLHKRFDVALEHFDHALNTSPNSAIAWTLKAATMSFLGDGPSAVQCASRGLELSPADTHVWFAEHILSQAHYINGDFEAAIKWGARSATRNQRLTSNLRVLAASLVASERIAEAAEVARQHLAIVPTSRLRDWMARTPLRGMIRESTVERLEIAGLPR